MSNYVANVELILLAKISFITRPGQIINMTVYKKPLLKIGKALNKQILFFCWETPSKLDNLHKMS